MKRSRTATDAKSSRDEISLRSIPEVDESILSCRRAMAHTGQRVTGSCAIIVEHIEQLCQVPHLRYEFSQPELSFLNSRATSRFNQSINSESLYESSAVYVCHRALFMSRLNCMLAELFSILRIWPLLTNAEQWYRSRGLCGTCGTRLTQILWRVRLRI